MKRHLHWILVAGLAITALVLSCSSDQPLTPNLESTGRAPLINDVAGAQYLDGAYIVVFKDDVKNVEMSIDDVGSANGFVAERRFRSALKGFSGRLTDDQVEALRNDPRVKYVEQDQVVHIATTQTGATWGIDRIDQLDLPLSTTYTYDYTGAGVDVYVIDTGIRFTHTDFGGRAISGVDEIDGGTADDANGHGTHVSGTIGGATYGVAKGVTLYAVRVLDASGSGTWSQVIAGIDWVTANHSSSRPSVANMSLGGGASTSVDDAVANSIAAGVTYCVASGNSGANASNYSPARVPTAITVAATTSTDAWATYSNYGSLVDILAPGSSVKSDYYTSDTATATMSGTSMASPHAAGVCALYLEANPSASPADVCAALVAASTPNTITGVPTGTVNKFLYSLIGGSTPEIPAAPVLSSPANGATDVAVPPTLAWNASAGATSYRLQVSTSSAFTTTAYDQAGLTSTSVSVTGLAASTTYYWRVNATNSAGTSGWSSVYSFTTAASSGSAPAAPVLLSPASGATGVSLSPTFSWYASTGATSYRLQVSRYSTFSSLVKDVSGITGTSTSVTGLTKNTTYYWRVNASNSYGTSAWSVVRSFRTGRR